MIRKEQYLMLSLGWSAMFCAGVLHVGQFAVVKVMSNEEIPPGCAIAFSNLFALMFVAPYFYIKGRNHIPGIRGGRKKQTKLYFTYPVEQNSSFFSSEEMLCYHLKNITKDFRSYFLALFSGLSMVCLGEAVIHIGLGDALSLYFLHIFISSICSSIYLANPMSPKQVLAIFFATSGTILIVRPQVLRAIFGGEPLLEERPTYIDNNYGYIYIGIGTLTASFTTDLMNSLKGRFKFDAQILACLFGNCFVGTIYTCLQEIKPQLTTSRLYSVMGLTAFVILASIFFSGAYARLPSSHQIIVQIFEPVYAYGLGFILFSEKPLLISIIGFVQIWMASMILGFQKLTEIERYEINYEEADGRHRVIPDVIPEAPKSEGSPINVSCEGKTEQEENQKTFQSHMEFIK